MMMANNYNEEDGVDDNDNDDIIANDPDGR